MGFGRIIRLCCMDHINSQWVVRQDQLSLLTFKRRAMATTVTIWCPKASILSVFFGPIPPQPRKKILTSLANMNEHVSCLTECWHCLLPTSSGVCVSCDYINFLRVYASVLLLLTSMGVHESKQKPVRLFFVLLTLNSCPDEAAGSLLSAHPHLFSVPLKELSDPMHTYTIYTNVGSTIHCAKVLS